MPRPGRRHGAGGPGPGGTVRPGTGSGPGGLAAPTRGRSTPLRLAPSRPGTGAPSPPRRAPADLVGVRRRAAGVRPGALGRRGEGAGVPPMRGVPRMDHRWLPLRCTGRADAQGLGGPRRARPLGTVSPARGPRGGRWWAIPGGGGVADCCARPVAGGLPHRPAGRAERPVLGRPPDGARRSPRPRPAITKTGAS